MSLARVHGALSAIPSNRYPRYTYDGIDVNGYEKVKLKESPLVEEIVFIAKPLLRHEPAIVKESANFY